MRSLRRFAVIACVFCLTALTIAVSSPIADAVSDLSFLVDCQPSGQAMDDPIVFPNQPGKSHLHTFYGGTVNASSTVTSLLAQPYSKCGSNFDTVDHSGYWMPALYQNGQPLYSTSGSNTMDVYYQRAGGTTGAPIAQAFPQGLRMIAGSATATTPQPGAQYKCIVTDDPGTQRGYWQTFPTCNSNETIVLELTFPDCWDGVHLDSADHKSHMAYSSGSKFTCPPDHPVKLPQIIMEDRYYGINGPASSFSLASGGAYTLHGDVLSAWDPHAFAGMVDSCLNNLAGCRGQQFNQVSMAGVTQAQIDAQLKPGAAGAAGAAAVPASSGKTHPTPAAAPVANGPPTKSSSAADASSSSSSSSSSSDEMGSMDMGASSPSDTSASAALSATSDPRLLNTSAVGESSDRWGSFAAAISTGAALLVGAAIIVWRRRHSFNLR
jgi:hypothetical protein